ncbi:MAG: hypothetical protein K2H85_03085 [Allobaculum sp.]|nr:hypothetical protein [Allobaculum sp.]
MLYHLPSPFVLTDQEENANAAFAFQQQGASFYPADPMAAGYSGYITNYAASPEVCNMFRASLNAVREELNSLHSKGDVQRFIRTIGMILTQQLHLIVRHQRWTFAYNGRIFLIYTGVQQLEMYLRELCETIPGFVKEFYCTPSFVKALLAEINQTCQNIPVLPDLRNLIAFRNGILNLQSMMLLPFTSDLFITSMVDADWNWYAMDCPNFWHLIMSYACGEQTLAYRILEALGTCLTNDYIKTIFCLTGVTNSGKSFIADYIRSLLNPESVVVMMPDEFGKQFSNIKIFNKSLCMCMDMSSAPLNPVATSAIKQISGGDMIASEVKYQNGNVNFESRTHLMLGSNFDIRPYEEDIAFTARKIVLPFCHRITDEQVNKEVLKATLEPERSAIVNLLINAYLNLRGKNYVFSGTSSWYDTYVPTNDLRSDCRGSIQYFVMNCCNITNHPQNYVFTEDLF